MASSSLVLGRQLLLLAACCWSSVRSSSSVSSSSISGLRELEILLDTDQQACLASCGVDYEELLASASKSRNSTGGTIRILSFDTGSMDLMGRQKAADMFYQKTGIQVMFELVQDFLGTYDEIRSQLEGKLPLYDGFICGPAIVGTAVQLDGFLDLTGIVRDDQNLQWLDVLRGFRENIAVYDNHVRMFPLDGDAHFMFYREDILEEFDLAIPRTWDEYWQTAMAVHGKQFNGRTLVGSCVGMKSGAHLSYWTSLILSSYTQTNGATQGFILDSSDLSPLMGEAMAETLKMLEMQAIYGHPEVFETCGGGDPCSINIKSMNEGECVLTYNWGDSYKASHAADSQAKGLIKVAPTPGSTKVLNRQTEKLEACTEEICGGVGGIYYEDIGWVNRASYLAFGGWSAAVNNNINEEQQKFILDYFMFMAGPEVSTDAAIPNATTATEIPNGVDPFRTSHLDVDKWVAQGFTRESAESYTTAVKDTLNHPNAAYDMRFAGADLIYSAMENEVHQYLEQAVLLQEIPEDEEDRQRIRLEVADRLDAQFRKIVLEEDAKAETLVPLLEQYQRDLGIYKPPSASQNYLAITIPIVVAILIGAAILVYWKVHSSKNDSVWKVKAEEIVFPDPQQIIGTGSFGLVLLAEYRGTQVAVKRMLPPKRRGKKLLSNSSHNKSVSSYSDTDESSVEASKKVGTTSWAGMNVSGISKLTSSSEGKHSMMKSSLPFYSAVSADRHDRALKEDFIKEMRIISKLRHPCITTVMGAVISKDSYPMLIMEYMDHGSLYDILKNVSIPLEDEVLLPMLSDITQGCRFLHASNPPIIHGDLKSHNVLVDSRFRAKVADFGLSHKQQLGVTGTPYWMAPELLRKETSNTLESDVYSFGIILYEAFSRKEPYEGEDPREVLTEVADVTINKRPPLPQDCSQQMGAIMKDCLLGNPEERPSFEELDKRIRRVEPRESDKSHDSRNDTVSLFDIFPKHIAEALRDGKKVEAEHKDMVTIFFSDIVGFTTISSTLEPHKVANLLDRLYSKFDALSHEHDIFKVETIGDAYMAVTNLVKNQDADHAIRIAEFAVSAITAANETLIDLEDPDKGHVNIRVGFHSGPIVADVVGSRNPRYCLFGDTVNTASRMESASKSNRIHCSKDSAEVLMKQNCKLPMTARGKVEIKGKGLMTTYWVNDEGPMGKSPGHEMSTLPRLKGPLCYL